MCVLAINNIRDMATDAANRRTVALRLGARRARWYQTALIVAGWVFLGLYFLVEYRYFAAAGHPVAPAWIHERPSEGVHANE